MMQETLKHDMEAFESRQLELASTYGDQWVIFKDRRFVGAFPTYDAAVRFGLKELGEADYLIRQIEDRPVSIPMLLVRE